MTERILGPDTSDLVIHYIYPNGRKVPDHMMDPTVGGWKKKCRHIYEYVNAAICPDCGRDTHEPDWKAINAYHKKWLKKNPDAWKEVGWWSI